MGFIHDDDAVLREDGAFSLAAVDGVCHQQVMIADLKQEYFLAIVSNCQCGYIEAFLEHYGFGKYIADIQCFGMNEVPKGENICLVVDRNRLEDAVYVGDIQGDYDASKAAGVRFVHAAYGFGEIADEVPWIECPSELKEVLRKIWS